MLRSLLKAMLQNSLILSSSKQSDAREFLKYRRKEFSTSVEARAKYSDAYSRFVQKSIWGYPSMLFLWKKTPKTPQPYAHRY